MSNNSLAEIIAIETFNKLLLARLTLDMEIENRFRHLKSIPSCLCDKESGGANR